LSRTRDERCLKPMDKIKILLVDDHTLFREALSRMLAGEPDLEMTAKCASVSDAIAILGKKHIDLVLLDHDLGRERGFEFIVSAKQNDFDGRILMVTAGMSDEEVLQVLRLGINGIFLKHSSPTLLVEAIHKVMAGETWLEQHSIRTLVEAVKHPEKPNYRRPFTQREAQVLRCIFEGLANKEIGVRLGISESSVKAVLQQLFQKTGVRTRSQLVRIVLEEHGGLFR
jgi:two-component system, NarL family, nitrate/nitrite response regulator NarL